MQEYGWRMVSGGDTANFLAQIAESLGKRVTIRIRESDGGLRDYMGVLQSETTLLNRKGEILTFNPSLIVALRVIPVFNRRDSSNQRLALYDTKSRSVQEVTDQSGVVTIYSCGPTVYRSAHVGNLRTFLLGDLIARALRNSDFEVRSIQNITDVGHMSEDLESEDKLLLESKAKQIDPFTIARKFEDEFRRDLTSLNITPATSYPRASENMDAMISAIEKLIAIGFAYVGSDGSVYFSAQSFESYGELSGNRLDELQPGHRYEFTGEGGKRFHGDWALWKLAGNRTQMVWDSPWGVGFPGWHIECTAMSLTLLDEHVNLHIGGIDLRFPHHENERAQSNAIVGGEVVDHWIHGEHLLFEGRKMSKSAGNVVLLADVIERGYDPLALRLVFCENRYRSQMDLTWSSIEAAHATLIRWRKALQSWGDSPDLKHDSDISTAIMSDLDTPRAVLRLRAIEKDMTLGSLDKRAIFLFADQFLGLDLDRRYVRAPATDEIQNLLDKRAIARADKDWKKSDELRDQLALLKIEVLDTPSGQTWDWI